MKISQKDARLLIFFACIVLLAASYFFGYKTYSDKTDDMNTKTQALKAQYESLEASNEHRDEYKRKIQDNQDKITTISAKYPSVVTNQDEIYLSSLIEKESGAWINTFNFSEPSIVYTPQNLTASDTDVNTDKIDNTNKKEETPEVSPAPANAEGTAKDGEFTFVGYKNSTQLSFQADYDQMKKLVAIINNYESRKSIKSVNLAVDKTTGLLTGTIDYDSYSLVSVSSKYTPLIIPSESMGIKNIFGDIVKNKEAKKKD